MSRTSSLQVLGTLRRLQKPLGIGLWFDIKDSTKRKNRRSNYMDLNSHSGFALLGKYIHAVIEFDYTLKLDLTVNLPSWRSNHWETCQ